MPFASQVYDLLFSAIVCRLICRGAFSLNTHLIWLGFVRGTGVYIRPCVFKTPEFCVCCCLVLVPFPAGSIPPELGKLQSLEVLNLHTNFLIGEFSRGLHVSLCRCC